MSALPKIKLDTRGVVVAPSSLNREPGSLASAVNMVVDAPGVIRSRQGFQRQSNGFGGPVWKLVTTKQLGSNLLINHGNSTAASGLKYGDGSAAATAITGTVTNQPETRMKVAVAHKNHYLTSDEGVRRLESSYSLFAAGQPEGLQLDQTGPAAVLTGAPGVVVQDGYSTAYRVTWAKKDADGLVMTGAPSARTVVYNNARTTGYAGGVTKNVIARVLLPKANGTNSTALTTSDYFQLWRSPETNSGEPSDDMRLVYEAFLAAGDITNGYVDVTDSTPETFRALSPALYTNANDGGDDGVGGPGVVQSNFAPPLARDVELFASCLFFVDLTYRAQLTVTLLSVVAATGLTAGDTVTVDGVVFTAIAPGVPAANQFVVVSAGGSTSEQIQRTAQNLVEAVNKSASNTTVYAFYVSGPNGLPGQVLFKARTATNTFNVVASAHGTAYRPALTTPVNSVNDTYSNGVAYSKPALPDAVPRVNVFNVGRDDTRIRRVKCLGNSLFLFSDTGLYRLIGRTWQDFSLQEFDLSFRLRGGELLCECDGALYAWGVEGVARITEAGLEYVSTPIEPLLWSAVTASSEDWVAAHGWMTAYRSRHKVVLGIPRGTSDRNAQYFYVLDTRLNAWTSWDFPRETNGYGRSTGAVRYSDDLLFFGNWTNNASDSFVFKEQRTYAASDYRDVDADGGALAISKRVAWNVDTVGPQLQQLFDEVHLFWEKNDTFSSLTTPTAAVLSIEGDYDTKTVTLAPVAGKRQTRVPVPQSCRRGARCYVTVTHSTAGEFFGLEGAALMVRPGQSTRTARA